MAQRLPNQQGGSEDDSNPLDATGLCLLSLDGGGVRGLSSLYILKRLMTLLNNERREAGLERVKPCEVFDLIGGTSTGGLIAIMLGRLEMEVEECINAYSRLMKAVFEEKSSRLPISWKGDIKARFDSKKLKSAVDEVIRITGASGTDAFTDDKKLGCRTFVCSVAKESAGITRLRSYTLPDEGNIPATICEAALATSAATGFFDPVVIGARQFVDGAFAANNPVDEVEGEAANIWSSGTGDLKPLVKCFISIGTGNPGKKAMEDDMLKFLSKTLVHTVTETENTERKFIARWAKQCDDKRYFRFNVEQGLQGVGLAEYKEQGVMETMTDEYLSHQVQKLRARDCVRNLKQKQDRTEISFASVVKAYEIVRTVTNRTTTRGVHWHVPFTRNHQFVGRDSHLNRLQNSLFTEKQAHKIAIFGLGGVGKTQIALELAFRTREKHENCSIFWLPATSPESFEQALVEISQLLGIAGIEGNQADAKKLVQRHLSQESAGQWLLIIDNIDDMDMWNNELKAYLPMSQQGRVIATTRSRQVAVKIAIAAAVIEVPEMNEEMAMQLLAKSLINQELLGQDQDARKLLEQLTFLPLAIVQAASYINQTGIVLSEYLSLLDEQEQDVIELLSEDFEDENRYHDVKNPVATTWLISFQQIRELDALAAEYLAFMSCVAPKDIPWSLLPPARPRKKMTDAIGLLNAYSFVSRRITDDTLDVHRLVHLAMRNKLKQQNELSEQTAKALLRFKRVFPNNNHENRTKWRRYFPHAFYLQTSDVFRMRTEENVTWITRFGKCLLSDGRIKEAEVTFLQAVDANTRLLGPEHPKTLNNMMDLANTWRLQGKYKAAKKLFQQILDLEEKLLPKNDPIRLAGVNGLASVLYDLGDYDTAEELYRQTLEGRRMVLGEEHHRTLETMNNLAVVLQRQNRFENAEEMSRRALEGRKRILEKGDPKLLLSESNLSGALANQGKTKEAEEQTRNILQKTEKILGKEHPDTLRSMGDLAAIFYLQRRYKEAEEMSWHLIKGFERVLGKGHPETLTTLSQLALALQGQGKNEEAEVRFRQVLEEQQKVLGKTHPSTLASMNNLVSVYWDLERFTEVEELLEQVIEMRKTVLGVEHPKTLNGMANLAIATKSLGRHDRAAVLMEECFHLQEQVLGAQHPDTIFTLQTLTQWRLENVEIRK